MSETPWLVKLVHKLSRKIRVLYSRRLRTLLQIGAGIVTAFDDLIVKKGLLEFRHLCRELSGMYRPYPIVFGGRKDERFGVAHIRLELIIGRDRREKQIGRASCRERV